LIDALLKAGASHVFVGESESWRRGSDREAIAAMDGVSVMPLDVSDPSSVKKLAARSAARPTS
jgi:NAD(P)-dependent dehydrogenase (short-subunit alcohol dehydrogenase family)